MASNKKNNVSGNPKNEDAALFKKLTRVFSGPINQKHSQNPRDIRRQDLNLYAKRFKSISGQSFRRENYDPFTVINSQKMANMNRIERYREFSLMEFTPELAQALNMFSDEMTTSTSMSPVLKIKCPNEEIRQVLHDLFYNILNVEQNLYHWCRNLCKYGDFFLYLDIDENKGIVSNIALPQEEVERLEGEDPTNPNYVQFQWNSAGMTFEAWQVIHFRILGHDKYHPYGTSVLDSARRSFRQLLLMEDAVMTYRIVRSPERRVFYIDTGGLDETESEQVIEQIVTATKRAYIQDDQSSRSELRFNAFGAEDDYYIPVNGQGSATKIETLPGGAMTGDIEDMKYMQNKMFTAIGIPRSYLISDEKSVDDKETLSQKDIHFARTIWRIQRSVISELYKIGAIHLITLGYSAKDSVDFSIELNNPSKIAELQELEVLRTKADAATQLSEKFFSRRYIYENIFDFTKAEAQRFERELIQDAYWKGKLASAEQGSNADNLGDFAGDLGDDMGDDMLGGDMDDLGFGDDAGGDLDLGETDVVDDDNALLAAPGNRDEEYLTPRSKGKAYRRVTTDKRNMGARKRSMKSQYADEKGKNTQRNSLPGLPDIKTYTEMMQEKSSGLLIENLNLKEDTALEDEEDFDYNITLRNIDKARETSKLVYESMSKYRKKKRGDSK